MLKIDILTSLQKKFMALIFTDEWFRKNFYLTGGTALAAFHLYHRYSEDLDFFCHLKDILPIPQLIDDIAGKMNAKVERTHTSPGFMRFRIDEELKIDVVADVGYRYGIPELRENFMVDNLKNIAINKVGAILGRLDTKDYVDLYLILKKENFDIFELINLAQNKDGGLEPFVWSHIIADVKRLSIMPRMLVDLKLDDVKAFFMDLRDRILDHINPSKK